MEFLDRLRRLFPDSDLSAFEGYLVPDCGLDANTKAVLLCESPHVDEVGSAPLRPLAGKSGKSVARVFVDVGLVTTAESNRSIGELVSAGCTELEWLGLMNACQLPLQEKAYEEGVRHEHGNLIGDLQAVRLKEKHGALEQSELACAIRDDLAERWMCLTRLVHSEPLLIACGEVARRFRDFAGLPGANLPNALHPSRDQWDRARDLHKALEQIKRHVEAQAVPRTPAGDAARRLREIRVIAERCASRLAPGPPAVAHGDVLYDERGLPR